MRKWRGNATNSLVGSALSLSLCTPLLTIQADASTARQQDASPLTHPISTSVTDDRLSGPEWTTGHGSGRKEIGKRTPTWSSGISCVPYAREVSGIRIGGNAWQWWGNAAGQYARGQRPEAGGVLAFRSNSRMRLGHVAVVRQVVNAREIIVDHANWPSNGMRGSVSHDVAVVDVSEANNWSAVRVQLSRKGEFGSVYPTYGFIYNRPDNGVLTASIDRPAPLPAINRVPSDLRPVAERPWHTFEEVAELPDGPVQRIDLRIDPSAGIR